MLLMLAYFTVLSSNLCDYNTLLSNYTLFCKSFKKEIVWLLQRNSDVISL